jgi:UDP-N-acetylmuramyl-tripeptide synthetase
MEKIQQGLTNLQGVSGRLEKVPNDLGFSVFVDYAHTPDALENVLLVLRELTRGRLITVFGCGGDRDREKRPMMGAAAGRLSDFVVLTSDNPRTESPLAILSDIVPGTAAVQPMKYEADQLAHGFSSRGYVLEPDRRSAIKLALHLARPDDTVIIAGKGHETYQTIGEKQTPFDDRAEAGRALQQITASAN